MIHLTEKTIQRDALVVLYHASLKTFKLWQEHGLGDDESISEPAYHQLQMALNEAATALGMAVPR